MPSGLRGYKDFRTVIAAIVALEFIEIIASTATLRGKDVPVCYTFWSLMEHVIIGAILLQLVVIRLHWQGWSKLV